MKASPNKKGGGEKVLIRDGGNKESGEVTPLGGRKEKKKGLAADVLGPTLWPNQVLGG